MTSEFTLTLHDTLAGYVLPDAPTSTGYFTKVFKGEPNALTPSAGKPLARWRVLRTQPAPEGIRTLVGQRMLAMVFGVFCYWLPTASEEKQRSDEDDIATVLIDLPNQFIALTASDYTIAGKAVSAITIEAEQLVDRAFPTNDAPVELRVLSFEVHARLLEAS